MRTIDIHAHISPEGFVNATAKGESWHGMTADALSIHRNNPKTSWTPEERLADMNSLGVDVQVLSTNAYFYNYDKDPKVVTAMDVEANDYVAQLTKDLRSSIIDSTEFCGAAVLPGGGFGRTISLCINFLGLSGGAAAPLVSIWKSPVPRDSGEHQNRVTLRPEWVSIIDFI